VRSIIHPMCGMLAASTLASETASTPVNSPAAPKRRIPRVLIALAMVNPLLVLPLWWRDGAWGSAWLVLELPLERLRFVLREF